MFISSCNELDTEAIEERQKVEDVVGKDVNLSLKKEFSQALAKVLANSEDVRELIQNEALKKIDYDYDVLYQLVKNKKLSNGATLEGLLLNYIDPSTLTLIEKKIPTLTIFVPKLPENTFSAEIWDVNNDIPVVGIRNFETNDVSTFDSIGDESIIQSYEIPAFPIVVVKENERIIINDPSTKSISSTTFSLKSEGGKNFTFLSDAFDNIKETSSKNINIKRTKNAVQHTLVAHGGLQIPDNIAKIYEAYDVYKDTEGWQRDYVYYGITPSSTKGPFNYNFKEHLVSFEMLGDPKYAMNKIADQTGDPRIDGKIYKKPIRQGSYVISGWSDGEFEFKVKVYLGAKSLIGTELTTYFRVDPSALFSVSHVGKRGEMPKTFIIDKITLKKVSLLLPLFEWNLENYSSSVKIAIEEVDASQTVVQTSTTSSEFATNFNFDSTFGERVKVGLKFGASQKETRTVSYQVSTTQGNDELGEVVVNFADNIIMSSEHMEEVGRRTSVINPDYNNKYSTGWYRIHVAPVKVN